MSECVPKTLACEGLHASLSKACSMLTHGLQELQERKNEQRLQNSLKRSQALQVRAVYHRTENYYITSRYFSELVTFDVM